jgi:uncharacterized protein (DUF1697 family)
MIAAMAAGETIWVALLRGINVGGNRKVPMARLRELCEQAGLSDVRSYIASGNLVFRSPHASSSEVETLVADLVEREHGFRVSVLARSLPELAEAMAAAPDDDVDHRYVAFLTERPAAAAVAAATAAIVPPARLDVETCEAHLLLPGGMASEWIRPPGLERLLGVGATVRNRRTAARVLAMAQELGD